MSGPWVWGPLSEYTGRYLPFHVGFVGFLCFTVGVATAQDLYTILICRFLQGAWGIATVTTVPGMIVDLWDARTRSIVTNVWSMTIVVGPSMGPIAGSFTVKNTSLGWRWTMWETLIISVFFYTPTLLILRETYGPVILQHKAAQLRFETKNWALHSRRDEQPVQARALLRKYGLKPAIMIMQEPILFVITLYNCFVYGITYLTFEAYPYAFGVVRQWDAGVSSLPFLSLFFGYVLASIVAISLTRRVIRIKHKKGMATEPEDQLPTMIVGSFSLMIGLFWFAWTSSPHVTWVPQVLAGPFIGAGTMLVFNPCMTYLMECYPRDTNSAMAANTIVRSFVAAAFPLFANQMYERLGVQWATSLLGFLCVAFTPAPILLYKYGPRVRSWSKFASDID
jgi:MFS transporter, DHA1 family, multidrug resistance protein